MITQPTIRGVIKKRHRIETINDDDGPPVYDNPPESPKRRVISVVISRSQPNANLTASQNLTRQTPPRLSEHNPNVVEGPRARQQHIEPRVFVDLGPQSRTTQINVTPQPPLEGPTAENTEKRIWYLNIPRMITCWRICGSKETIELRPDIRCLTQKAENMGIPLKYLNYLTYDEYFALNMGLLRLPPRNSDGKYE